MLVKFEGLEVARKEFNSWQGKAVIFIDFEDMTAWCRVHDIPSYHSNTIIRAVVKDDLYSRNLRVGAERLEKIISLMFTKYKEGWSKEEIQQPAYYSTDESYVFI